MFSSMDAMSTGLPSFPAHWFCGEPTDKKNMEKKSNDTLR